MRPMIRRRILAAMSTVTMLLLPLMNRVSAEQLGVTLPAPLGATVTQGGAPNFSDSFITPFVATESGTIVSWKAQFSGGQLNGTTLAGVPSGIQLKVLRSISSTQVQVIGAGNVHDPRPALQARFGAEYPFFPSAESVLQFSEKLALSPGDIIGVTISANPAAGAYFYPLVGVGERASRIVTRDVGLGGIIDLSDLFTGTFAGLAPSIEVLTVAARSTLPVDSVHGVITDASPCPSPRDSRVFKTISKAIACARGGDVINIAPGTYPEQFVVGTALSGLTIRSNDGSTRDGSAEVVISPTEPAFADDVVFPTVPGGGIVIRASFVTLQGLKIVDATSGHRHPHSLVSIQADDVSVLNSWVVGRGVGDLAAGCATDSAVMVVGTDTDGTASNLTVRSSEIEKSCFGIRLRRSADASLEGNVVHHNLNRGLAIQEVPGTKVEGNTFLRNPIALEATNTGPGTMVWSNLFQGNDTGLNCTICGLMNNDANTFIENATAIRIENSTLEGIRSVHRDLFVRNAIGILCRTCGLMNNDGNTFSGNGVAIQIEGSTATGMPTLHHDSITGNGIGLKNLTGVPVDAQFNYWGCPTGPNSPGCDTTSGAVDTAGSLVAGTIDIWPLIFPNPVNPGGKGWIAVGVLTNATFDASTIDVATVRFGVTGAEAAITRSALIDVDFDGDIDLISLFESTATKISCASRSAALSGRTLVGDLFQGSDSVRPVGCKEGR